MIISCQQCATQYHLASKLVKSKGSKVRCSKCHHIFVTYPTVEATAGASASLPMDVEELDLDGFEDDPIERIDADLRAADFLGEGSGDAMDLTASMGVGLKSEGEDMPDLADELDKILGPDESSDASFLDGMGETMGQEAQSPYAEEDDLMDLDQGFDNLLNGDQSAVQETTTEDSKVDSRDEIEVLDLSELEDDFVDSSENEPSMEEIAKTGSELDPGDEISLDAIDDALDVAGGDEVVPVSDFAEESDPDLEVASLFNEQDGLEDDSVGTDTIAIDDPMDSSIGDAPSVEESSGLDTIQIEDFEFDLNNLEDLEPDQLKTAELSEEETDPGLDMAEAKSHDLMSDDEDTSIDDFSEPDLEPGLEPGSEPGSEPESENLDGFLPELDDLKGEELSDQEKDLSFETDEIKSLDIEPVGLEESTSTKEEPPVKEAAEQIEDFNIDTDEVDAFDEKFDGLEKLISTEDDAPGGDTSGLDEDFSFDTNLIESMDEELDNLEALISPEDEVAAEETSAQDDGLSLDTGQTDLLDKELDGLEELISAEDGSQEEDPSDEIEDFNLDTRQIESFDLDLENLDEIESSEDQVPAVKSLESDSLFDLDADQIKALDLESESTEALDLTGDDFILNQNEVDSLDLEINEIDFSADDADQESDEADEGMDILLDTDQIESLNLELESTDMPDAPSEGIKNEKSEQGPTDSDKKTADILNLDLERPDLDDGDGADFEDGIDLPVLDELLAPAEVTDDTLVDDSFDFEMDSLSAEKPESTDSDSEFMDQLEEASPTDSLPILELDDIDKKVVDTDNEIEPVMASPVADDQETAAPMAESQEDIEAAPASESFDTVSDAKEPMPPGRFETIPKRRTSMPLLILMAIVLLLALLFGLNAMGIKIPGLSNLNIPFLTGGSGQVMDETGSARIKTADITSKFVSNKKSGRLFVITGQALNQYDETRGSIQVKGNIYATGGKQVATQFAQCGNMLSDADLTAKPVADLQRHLSNKAGVGGSSAPTVGPGKTLPFMIIFAGLPPDIEEFSVEVVGSKSP